LKITIDTLVSLDVKMYDAQGNLLEESTDPLVYLHGAGDIFPAIERALEAQEAGFEISLQLEPNEAFGDDDPGLLRLVPRASLGSHVAIGVKLEGVPGQENDGRIYTVTDLTDTLSETSKVTRSQVISSASRALNELRGTDSPQRSELARFLKRNKANTHGPVLGNHFICQQLRSFRLCG